MFPRTHKRKAISTVLTTMIILVASVVLGTGVVIYGTSLFQTGAQSESISTQGVKLWVDAANTTGISWGASAVRNTGDKLESIDTIKIRGVAMPYTSWYYANTTNSLPNIQDQFVYGTTWTNGTLKNYLGPTGSTPIADTSAASSIHTIKLDVHGLGRKPAR